MSIILKFDLPSKPNVARLRVPKGTAPLHVGSQRGSSGYDEPKLWVTADADAFEQNETCWFEVHSRYTGAIVKDDMPYLGTAILHGGSIVVHYFGRVVVGD